MISVAPDGRSPAAAASRSGVQHGRSAASPRNASQASAAGGADPVAHGRIEGPDAQPEGSCDPEQRREHLRLGVHVPVPVDVGRGLPAQREEAVELATDLLLRHRGRRAGREPEMETHRQGAGRRGQRRRRERAVHQGARGRHHAVAVRREDALVDGRVVAEVVGDHQYPTDRHPGSSTRKEAPLPGLPWTRIFPPWASTISRATYRPSPSPG